MSLNTNLIAPMPENHARLAIKLEAPYGADSSPGDLDAIRVIEPKRR